MTYTAHYQKKTSVKTVQAVQNGKIQTEVWEDD